jgi:sarcosine oxidase
MWIVEDQPELLELGLIRFEQVVLVALVLVTGVLRQAVGILEVVAPLVERRIAGQRGVGIVVGLLASGLRVVGHPGQVVIALPCGGDGVTESYDVVVVGCGGAGAATTWWLARQGVRVLAIDRFEAGHTRGSSHGTERIVRLAYGDPVYVALAQESLPIWGELDATLVRTVGGVDTGFADELEQVAHGCDARDVAYEWLDADTATHEFPGLHFDGRALAQRDAGCVDAERALDAFGRAATRAGATIRRSELVTGIRPDPAGVEVTTDRDTYRAETVVVTTGAWAQATLAGLVTLPPITVTQEQVAFFRPYPGITFPTFIDRREVSYYGLPTPDGLLKVGEHYTGPVVDPDTRHGELEPRTWQRLLEWVRRNVPGVDPEPVDHSTCLYASAPDEDFVVDRVGQIVVGVGLGGHGFKFLPVLGRRLAQLATGTPWLDNPFRLERPPRLVGRSGHK